MIRRFIAALREAAAEPAESAMFASDGRCEWGCRNALHIAGSIR